MLEMLVDKARAELSVTKQELAAARGERDALRVAYHRLFEQVELLRRRIYSAKAERVNPVQLELEFKRASEFRQTRLARESHRDR